MKTTHSDTATKKIKKYPHSSTKLCQMILTSSYMTLYQIRYLSMLNTVDHLLGTTNFNRLYPFITFFWISISIIDIQTFWIAVIDITNLTKYQISTAVQKLCSQYYWIREKFTKWMKIKIFDILRYSKIRFYMQIERCKNMEKISEKQVKN